jgi:muramidase (phage lysozyme)
VLSTYNSVVSAYAAATFSQESVTLYGSARLGEYRPNEQDANAKSLPATRAYQLLRPTFKRLQKIEPKIKDFGPVSQDLAVIKVFDVVGALESIKKGDIDKAIAPLIKDQWGNTQFASLPGGGQEAAGMSIDKVKTMFKQNIVKELNNKSDIATH